MMKSNLGKLGVIALVCVLSAVPALAQGGGPGLEAYLQTLPIEPLSPQETSLIDQLRQEEKLARDVYLTLAQSWNLPIFSNIAGSEQQHMNAVAFLINRYGLPDPAANDTVGVFQDPLFTQIYDVLVLIGQVSPRHALFVGNIIEDLDINDLEQGLSVADNADVRTVFQNLFKGSRNHLRSFYSVLSAQGWIYTPLFIDWATFMGIVNTPHEFGIYDQNGDPI